MLFSAVREDRSPGGKHRHKRPRTDEYGNLLPDISMNMEEDPMLKRLIEAQPDRIPKAEGSLTSNITCDL